MLITGIPFKMVRRKSFIAIIRRGCKMFCNLDYSGLDPEIANNGVDNTIYPRQRSILGGVNVNFNH
jgi:iron complex outermembrane receptor protein